MQVYFRTLMRHRAALELSKGCVIAYVWPTTHYDPGIVSAVLSAQRYQDYFIQTVIRRVYHRREAAMESRVKSRRL